MADVTSSTQTVKRRTLRPWGSAIPVEVLSVELNLSSSSSTLRSTSFDGDEFQPLPRDRTRPRLSNAEMVETVEKEGGKAAGETLTPRMRCHRHLSGIKWQLALILICCLDVAMLVVESANGSSNVLVHVVTALVLSAFVLDIAIRFYTYRTRLLACHSAASVWFYFDVLVVGASVIFFFWALAIAEEATSTAASATPAAAARGAKALRGVILALRWMRSARFATKLLPTSNAGRRAARRITSQNKRRYVDLERGIDLDLAYLVPSKLIAMSLPAMGLSALYRNPLSEVARFLEARHGKPAGYTIINCCPEHPYPVDKFVSGEVVRFDIQDHTPPTMEQFCEFLNLLHDIPEERLVAIHCRGGKGRTGSMCCAWLLYSRMCVDADDALAFFALMRTELSLGKRRLQGVDTPSQRRYIHQLHALLSEQGAYMSVARGSVTDGDASGGLASPSPRPLATLSTHADDDIETASAKGLVRPPASPRLALMSLELSGWWAKPPKHSLVCTVHVDRQVVHWSAPVDPGDAAASTVTFDLGGFIAAGDLRVSVFDLDAVRAERARRERKGLSPRLPFDDSKHGPWGATGGPVEDCAKRVIAGKEVGCAFFLLFHSGFANLQSGCLPVPLQMMDKAFKNKRNRYQPEGIATLKFQAGETLEGSEPWRQWGREYGAAADNQPIEMSADAI